MENELILILLIFAKKAFSGNEFMKLFNKFNSYSERIFDLMKNIISNEV